MMSCLATTCTAGKKQSPADGSCFSSSGRVAGSNGCARCGSDKAHLCAGPAPGRHFPPNFYYNQEDYLARRVREGAPWTWNALRPGPICGYSHGSAMNVVVSTALYATLCKELDLGVLRCAALSVFLSLANERGLAFGESGHSRSPVSITDLELTQ